MENTETHPIDPRLLTEEEIEEVIGRWVDQDYSTRSISLNRGHWERIAPIIAQAQLDKVDKMKRLSPTITIAPGFYSGEPCIRWRLPADLIALDWWNNWKLEDLMDNYEITRGDVLVSCWYMAKYGPRSWRKRWGEWLQKADGELWYGRYETCPMPPQKNENKGGAQ